MASNSLSQIGLWSSSNGNFAGEEFHYVIRLTFHNIFIGQNNDNVKGTVDVIVVPKNAHHPPAGVAYLLLPTQK